MRAARVFVWLLLFILIGSGSVAQAAGRDALRRAQNAVAVLDEVMKIPERSIPRNLFSEAYAIAVIPNVVKAGFVVGARHGKGVISVRSPQGTWSNPSFLSLTGASVGFQAGIQSTDVVLVFRSQRGVDSIIHGKVTLGADAAVAAGPIGRTAEASTDSQLKAEIYSYSRARGLFAGIALDGAMLAIDGRANEWVYGRDVTPRMIFEGRVRNVPNAVVDFRDRLEEYTSR